MGNELRRAYPETPPSFDERMRRTLANLPPRRDHRRLCASVAVALAAMLALSGLALAASRSDLLRRLFRGGDPTPQAETLLTQLDTAVKRDGVALSIDEYLMDGADLYVRWTVASERDEPLMLVVSDPEIEFEAEAINDDNAADWHFNAGVLLDAEHPSYSAVSRLHFEENAPAEAFDVGFTAALLRPVAPMIDWDEAEGGVDSPVLLQEEWEDCVQLTAVDGIVWDGDGYTLSSDLGDGDWSMEAMLAALANGGYATEALRIPVRFEVEPDAEHMVHTEIVGSGVFSFDRFALIVDRADFTAAGVTIRYRIAIRHGDRFGERLWFEVMPDGQPADNAFMESKRIGNGMITGEIVARAGSDIPEWFRLVPRDEETDQLLPQYAVEIRLRQR